MIVPFVDIGRFFK